MSSCLIQLDNYPGQYYTGSVIAGRVICSFNSPENIGGVKLNLRGEEENQWTRNELCYNEEKQAYEWRNVCYSGHNTFLHLENTLRGEGDLGPGRFEYPFTFQLPSNLSSTYQGRYGGIFFSFDVNIDRPFQVDYTDKKQIVVVSPINLNLMKNKLQLEPIHYSIDKTLCCWWCASGHITMEVHLDKDAFVVGEVVKVRLDITNISDESIERVCAQLGMEVKCSVTSPSSDSKSDYELLATDIDTGIGAHGQRTYNLTLEIPESAQVPNFNSCELFRLESILTITAVLESCNSDMVFNKHVTIGHIPVEDRSSPAEQSPPNTYQLNMYPPNTHPPNTYPPDPVMFPHPPAQGPVSGPMSFAVLQGADAAPSAPPLEGRASAPSKREMAEQELVVVGTEKPQSSELPPPSYDEAMSFPKKK